MNCCNEYGECKHEHGCPVREMPVTMAPEPLYDYIMRKLWTGMAWLGFFSMIVLIAFFWGYKS